MPNEIISKYPYTDLHSVNLDYILKVVRENAGLHLEVSGNQLLMKTADNTIISSITIPYATSAGSANTASSASYASTAGSAASANYAATAGTATSATNATNATNAATADYASDANEASHAITADHATSADSATYATSAGSAASADYATTTGNVEHALNAFEKVEADGNNLKFTKGDNTTSLIQAPFATKAYRDNSNNIISTTYVANVVNDNGTLKFNNALGNTIVSITPTTTIADQDSYGNTIADYIKTITQASGSNYLTVSTGTGATDTITINYANTAWKDTNGNVIKNTYIKRLEIVTDPDDGHKKLVAYNGDDPEAELFRFEIEAYSAQVAAEATHAASADYATSAGSAATAATSTGSVSSIARNRNVLTITNGDGTTSTIDITKASQKYLYMKDTVNNNTNLFDAAFTVGHEEEFGITNYNNPWGDSTAWDSIYEGVWIYYSDNNNWIMFESPVEVGFNNNGGGDNNPYILKIFDGNAGVIKVFEISEPADISLTPGNVTVKRVL